MRYGLITPPAGTIEGNAGWFFITAGIKSLIKQQDKEATFEYLDFFDLDKWPTDEELKGFNKLVICGNPRYDLSTDDTWLYHGMLDALNRIHKNTGVGIIDGWQGAGAPLGASISESIEVLTSNQRNQNIVKLLKQMKAKVITRCPISQGVNEALGLNSVQRPCSSFWGARSLPVPDAGPRTRKVVIVNDLGGYHGSLALVRTLGRTHEIIATNGDDARWCERENLNFSLVYSPKSLCTLYKECEEVISFRLHAAIPAASLGAKVWFAAIDSRVCTTVPFGIPSADYREGIGQSKLCITPDCPPIDW